MSDKEIPFGSDSGALCPAEEIGLTLFGLFRMAEEYTMAYGAEITEGRDVESQK